MTASKRPTPRKLAVQASGIFLLLLADPRPISFGFGCFFVALAWLLRAWAFGHLSKNETLVTTGPYAHTRNPAYFGSFLALLGVSLAAGNLETDRGLLVWGFGALLLVAFFMGYLPRKFSREHGRMERLFGDEAIQHGEHVPAFWPQLRPWRSGSTRKFSIARVGENHEWAWAFVLSLLMVALWFAPEWSPLGAWLTE